MPEVGKTDDKAKGPGDQPQPHRKDQATSKQAAAAKDKKPGTRADSAKYNVLSVGGPDQAGVRTVRIQSSEGAVFDVPEEAVSASGDQPLRPQMQVEVDGDPEEIAARHIEERISSLNEELDQLRSDREKAQDELNEAIAASVETKRSVVDSIDADIAWREREVGLLTGTQAPGTAASPMFSADPARSDFIRRASVPELTAALRRHEGDERGSFSSPHLADSNAGEIRAELLYRGHRG